MGFHNSGSDRDWLTTAETVQGRPCCTGILQAKERVDGSELSLWSSRKSSVFNFQSSIVVARAGIRTLNQQIMRPVGRHQ